LQIPNLKTPAVAHQRDRLQSERSTKFLRQKPGGLAEPRLRVERRMQVPQENARSRAETLWFVSAAELIFANPLATSRAEIDESPRVKE
jgi:hypothetical protein